MTPPAPLVALGIVTAVVAAVALLLAWRRRRVLRLGAADLVASYRLNGARALVLAFTTPECAPCKTVQRPALQALEQRFPGQVVVAEVDALRERGLAARFGILTVPSTVVIASTGRVRAVNSGAVLAERLARQIGLLEGP
ncbi:MAG: thioredoxin family protein [Armatimonadota bacterium]|nr:thioredoxin family protein [Armatimonadota bacterium]MDR7485892.1 thioredoxin family protein [Armatimonadota bacterium]MDR7533157.1 thioredoxin family protein [Armatimonadota bacterium]MDR7536597.1 thioredoxin family protein [Armatimonadota bacterium]